MNHSNTDPNRPDRQPVRTYISLMAAATLLALVGCGNDSAAAGPEPTASSSTVPTTDTPSTTLAGQQTATTTTVEATTTEAPSTTASEATTVPKPNLTSRIVSGVTCDSVGQADPVDDGIIALLETVQPRHTFGMAMLDDDSVLVETIEPYGRYVVTGPGYESVSETQWPGSDAFYGYEWVSATLFIDRDFGVRMVDCEDQGILERELGGM